MKHRASLARPQLAGAQSLKVLHTLIPLLTPAPYLSTKPSALTVCTPAVLSKLAKRYQVILTGHL